MLLLRISLNLLLPPLGSISEGTAGEITETQNSSVVLLTDRQTCRYINKFIDQIWTFSGRLIVTHHNILHVTVHGGVGDVLPDDLQRTLDDVMAAGLFAQISLAPGCGFQAALSTSGEGTARLTQDDGAGDVHLWGGRWEWVCVCVCSCHNKRFTLQHSLTKV